MEKLIATTARDYTFHAGQWAKHIPAGTLVEVSAERIESGAQYVVAYVASNRRISEVLPVAGLIPA